VVRGVTMWRPPLRRRQPLCSASFFGGSGELGLPSLLGSTCPHPADGGLFVGRGGPMKKLFLASSPSTQSQMKKASGAATTPSPIRIFHNSGDSTADAFRDEPRAAGDIVATTASRLRSEAVLGWILEREAHREAPWSSDVGRRSGLPQSRPTKRHIRHPFRRGGGLVLFVLVSSKTL
jgi:hypothetical protein